jgi:flagellar hook-associated protein 3 FlgL
VISAGSVTDPTALTDRQYRIVFTETAGATTYQIYDAGDLGTPLLEDGPVPFVEGESIYFRGMQFDIKGKPANSDYFTIEPSSNESIFTTVKDLILALNQPAQSPASRAQLQNSLIEAGGELASMLESVLTVRASLGIRMQEVERLDETGLDRELFYAEALSDLQDLDYVKALSDLSRQQVMLEAAQKTFVTVSGMSLFKML